jgi:XTP/dITP diphosphohydrolase
MEDTLVFATGNRHKIAEVNRMLEGILKVVPMAELGQTGDLPENQDTLAANALEKAWYLHRKYGINCFSEDSGLEIDALDGRPGVRSARYAGEGKNDRDNIRKVLEELQEVTDRRARFRTVIALIYNEAVHFFEGAVEGWIIDAPQGEGGFGYDPIFRPEGHARSFAEMDQTEKDAISHRGRAIRQLIEFLKQNA